MMMRPACRECWEPVDDAADELCFWHKMSPEQRRRAEKRGSWAAIGLVVFLLCSALLSEVLR